MNLTMVKITLQSTLLTLPKLIYKNIKLKSTVRKNNIQSGNTSSSDNRAKFVLIKIMNFLCSFCFK